jgi:hypothetical protein
MTLTDVAESVGKGFFAGLVGTAAITASMQAEAKMRKQELPPVQAEAVEKVVGVEPRGEREKQRLANLVHWQYGAAWGGLRGLFAALGLRAPPRDLGPLLSGLERGRRHAPCARARPASY